MSISIKPDAWHVKDGNGQYRGTAIFSSTLPSEAQQIVTESIAEINAVKATIPADYTELSDAVDDLTGDVSDLSNAISANEEAIADTQSMIATVEATTTASKNYAVGDAFIHSGTLYKATASITLGDVITPGTNCTQTTLISIIKGE